MIATNIIGRSETDIIENNISNLTTIYLLRSIDLINWTATGDVVDLHIVQREGRPNKSNLFLPNYKVLGSSTEDGGNRVLEKGEKIVGFSKNGTTNCIITYTREISSF